MAQGLRARLWGSILLNGGPESPEAPRRGLSQEMHAAIRDIKARYYDVDAGTVDYPAIAGSEEYRAYQQTAARLRRYDPAQLADDRERLAFWVNLYNTIVVDGVIALGIRRSVHEVHGFFRRVYYEIGGHRFSPDDIEHGVLRGNARHPTWRLRQFSPWDPRRAFAVRKLYPEIHFALVCGSRSCAPIRFYSPERIHEELEVAAVNFVNSPEVTVDVAAGLLRLSRVFLWYAPDFGGRAGVLDFIARHLLDYDHKRFVETRGSRLRVEYIPYDWGLNR